MNTNEFRFSLLPRPALMGILNITPNSFSDGGLYADPAAAAGHAEALVREGAALLDLGAEASSFFRTGVDPVPAEEQLRRLMPVVERLAERSPGVRLSIDTRSAFVARETLRAGAVCINDISAGAHDPAILDVVAEEGASMVLMHMGESFPRTPERDDPDIVRRVTDDLQARVEAALRAGIAWEKLSIDPGVGFGKTAADSWRLAMDDHVLRSLGVPIVLGASRKRFLEADVPPAFKERWLREVQQVQGAVRELQSLIGEEGEMHPRDMSSAAITRIAAGNGMAIHRVHHVTMARLALTLSPFGAAAGTSRL